MAKRTFELIRLLILNSLRSGSKTVNQLANESGMNWKTVDNHIIHLLGRGLIKEVYFCKYVKIVELSEKGKEFLNQFTVYSSQFTEPETEDRKPETENRKPLTVDRKPETGNCKPRTTDNEPFLEVLPR